ncbi:MAG: DUF1015 domain-containing protein [Syntrophomonadaceae bacterium]|nr:DUF1015 domain-containing protein [Syntrophomonadaceae bacterium]
MATIVPIRGIRYVPEKVGDIAEVVTPPYDIIDSIAQARYYSRHPNNIIRLELGQIFQQDDDRQNRYTRAAGYFTRWLEEGILARENKPALYLYEQEFTVEGKRLVRTGFFCGLELKPYGPGNVLPHEETLSKPKADRLQLMRACRANFSPVFGLYHDPLEEINRTLRSSRGRRPPEVSFVDEAGESHRLWVIRSPRVHSKITRLFKERTIFIADGHHRFETALSFYQESLANGESPLPTVLVTLVNLHDPGLLILPTHRLVKDLKDFDSDAFKEQLLDYFKLEAHPLPGSRAEQPAAVRSFLRELRARGETAHAFGFYSRDKILYLLTLKKEVSLQKLFPGRSEAWSNLDVAILDHLVLDRLLQIGGEQRRSQDHLTYTHSELEAVEAVDSGAEQAAFLLNPTRVEQVIAVARNGEKMPQKSTYFYPKLITGLVINPLFS